MTPDQEALAKALCRIEELEQIIFDLYECYKWDRAEYQSHPGLVQRAESALVAVRWRNRNRKSSGS